MPVYEYSCTNCGASFSLLLHISEHEKGNIQCPECKGVQVVQRYTPFYAKTAKKS